MRNKTWLALLIAPVVFVAPLLSLGEHPVQTGQIRYSYNDRNDYVRSVAVVWALDSIKDKVSCNSSLSKYQRDYRGLPNDARNAISGTYEDLAGACDDHDPPRQARQRAAAFLEGMSVSR
ncbi:MAG TPA: hypothetical protein VLB32_00880 [Candidatus Acidoferrales bacterium]|nr:hypothetical protein [Candidatus Acidoferrales bacterium]